MGREWEWRDMRGQGTLVVACDWSRGGGGGTGLVAGGWWSLVFGRGEEMLERYLRTSGGGCALLEHGRRFPCS
mgnify:CR=1 FL=1